MRGGTLAYHMQAYLRLPAGRQGRQARNTKNVFWEWVKVRTPVRFLVKGKMQRFKDRQHNLSTKPAPLPAIGRVTLTLRPTTFVFYLNTLIGSNKFTVVIKGNSLFSLHEALNIGRTMIIGYQGESNVIEIFIELGKVINSHSYIKIGVK